MSVTYSQCRLVKKINAERQVTTFSKLGKLYENEQKTLRGQHSAEDVIERAIKYNPNLKLDVLGLTVVQFKSNQMKIAVGNNVKQYVTVGRKMDSTTWEYFIDKKNEIFEVTRDHKIGHKAGAYFSGKVIWDRPKDSEQE
jgi:hypothetical protein